MLVKMSKEVEVAGQHTANLPVTGYSDMAGRFTRVPISHPVTAIHMVMRIYDVFDVRMCMDHKYISKVQPTRCNIFSIYLFL
jgi:hypothetical protein